MCAFLTCSGSAVAPAPRKPSNQPMPPVFAPTLLGEKRSILHICQDYLGSVVPNFWGTLFTLYDSGVDARTLSRRPDVRRAGGTSRTSAKPSGANVPERTWSSIKQYRIVAVCLVYKEEEERNYIVIAEIWCIFFCNRCKSCLRHCCGCHHQRSPHFMC